MKTALLLLLASLAAAVASGQLPAPAAGGSPLAAANGSARKTDPFERTRKQIEGLTGHRVNPPKFEPARYNPFLLGALPDATAKTGPGDEPPVEVVRPVSSDETILQELAAQLRVTGSFRRESRTLLVINGAPRGEGDSIALPHAGDTATVRIKSITLGWYVVTYGKAELQLRY